jgi:hypothetical protein
MDAVAAEEIPRPISPMGLRHRACFDRLGHQTFLLFST